ncbi:MAG: lysophospholipid acyltransferase family protein [Acidobacteriota bacterium]|nr:lysophospholipid acyltransferase family protein [Acidobacteriota bacterium]
MASLLIRIVGCTLRYVDLCEEGAVPGTQLPAPRIYAFWHRTLLASAWRFRNMGIAILISPSFDGELIARTVARLGFVPVRGSSSRGGAEGLRQLERAFRKGHDCAITADGPRGPIYVAKPGVAHLASLLDQPVGTFFALPERAWQLRSWDHFLIPKPFSRVFLAWPHRTAGELPLVQQKLDLAVQLASDAAAQGRSR